MLNILIAGRGPVGLALAALSQTSSDLTSMVVGRHQTVEKGPWSVEYLDSQTKFSQQMTYIAKPFPIAATHILFIAVKAYDLRQCLRELLPELPSGCPVVYLGNGFVEDILSETAQTFTHVLVRPGICTYGAKRPNRSQVISLTAGSVFWGPLDDSAPTTTETALTQSLKPWFSWDAQCHLRVQKKWIFSCSLNSLCALLQLSRNGLALEHLEDLRKIFEEAWILGQRVFNRPWPWPKDELWQSLLDLIAITKENENSMVQDLRNGRPTELPFLAGLSLPHADLKLLHKVVKAITSQASAR